MGCGHKKLTEVVEVWATGGNESNKALEDDWVFFGGDLKDLVQPETDTEVHPDNWLALRAFTAVQTQWVLDNKNRRYALDYQRADICWQKLGLIVEGDDFFKVQHLEQCLRETV